MLNFDSAKLRSVYVYIVKVTGDYVYVTSHRNGEPYTPKGSNPVKWEGETISRVPIHPTVYAGYKAYCTITRFSEPRLAALNYYGDVVVSLEAQQYSAALKGFQKADYWQSYFSRSVKVLTEKLADKTAYINGIDIYWFENKRNTPLDQNDDAFSLANCQVVKISSLGRPSRSKEAVDAELEAQNTGNTEALDKLDDKFFVSVNEGMILEYRPMEGISVHSPVLASIPGLFGDHATETDDKDGKRILRALYNMNGSSPTQANLRFLTKASNVIGEMYGQEATDFLNVPHVVMATGHTCLVNIPSDEQDITPIGRSAVEALSWIFRYIYAEKDLSNLRDLMRMMKFCLLKGLMPLNEASPFLPGADASHIPKVTYQSAATR